MTTVSIPIQVLRGLYLGALTGIIPALVAWGLGFLFRYVTGITAPAFAVVVLGVAIAGVNGGFLALNDPAIVGSANSITLVTALLVVMMASFYAHHRGDALGASTPRLTSLKALRERTLSTDVIEFVGGRGRVQVTVAGPVTDMEGHPPLSPTLRNALTNFEATLPADLPVEELETRFADRLRAAHDLDDVAVSIDDRGRASVTAAPPVAGVSKRVPAGKRAVSIEGLVPTGLDRGDEIEVVTTRGSVPGTVVSARAGGGESMGDAPSSAELTEDTQLRSGTVGGVGRVTVAVDRPDAATLLDADSGNVVVTSRGTRREFELISLLRRGDGSIRRVTAGPTGSLTGQSLRDSDLRDEYGVAVLAVGRDGRWRVAPAGSTTVTTGDELFLVGPRSAVDTVVEAVA